MRVARRTGSLAANVVCGIPIFHPWCRHPVVSPKMRQSSNSRSSAAQACVLSRGEPILVPGLAWSLSVRCRSGHLQVITLWQVIGCYASRVKRFRAATSPGAPYEEFTVTFMWIPESALVDMVTRLAALPWVLDAWFYP